MSGCPKNFPRIVTIPAGMAKFRVRSSGECGHILKDAFFRGLSRLDAMEQEGGRFGVSFRIRAFCWKSLRRI